MKKTASKNNASFIKAQEEMIGQSKTTFFYSFTIIEFLALTLKELRCLLQEIIKNFKDTFQPQSVHREEDESQ